MSRTLNTLLACWMAVATTGTVVSHRHAAAAGHAHGYGWVSLAAPADATTEANAHHHFVLAGIEFGALPGSHDGERVVADGPPLVAGSAADAPAAFFTLVGWCDAPPSNAHPAPPLPVSSALCAAARHARSGVLLS